MRIFFAPPAMFLYLLPGRGLILDGWPGWYYVMQRTIAEMLLSLRLLTEREGVASGSRFQRGRREEPTPRREEAEKEGSKRQTPKNSRSGQFDDGRRLEGLSVRLRRICRVVIA